MSELRRGLSFLVSALIAAVLIAGCGGDDSSDEPPAELEDQLGFSDEAIVERQSRVEGDIQQCMRAQGFDYIPVDPLAQRAALTGKARISEEDFIEQFGYGITTLFGRGTEQSDPNERIRTRLSGADRAAYDRALFGDNPGLTFAEALDSDQAADLGGCTREATEKVFGGTGLIANLQEKLDELEDRVLQDQRMVKAIEAWSQCMEEQGYQYEEPEEIDSDLLRRLRAIVGPGVEEGATSPPDENASYDRAALTELQRDEVRIVNADVECEEEHITPIESVVRPQYEATFRRQNRRLLARVPPVKGGEEQ